MQDPCFSIKIDKRKDYKIKFKLYRKMSEFVFYELVNDISNIQKNTKINEDKLMKGISITKKADALFSQVEVASSIIKELYKVEEKYKNIVIIDVYTLELNNFCDKHPNIKLKLTLDKDYYPMLTPDISLNPSIDPIYMYEMLSHSDLDPRNMSKIRNINYIISRVKNFLENYSLECKLDYLLTDSMITLLKNNNFKMKTKELIDSNIIKEKVKSNGIGYGGKVGIWDVNAYLNNLVRIKESNEIILERIVNFIENNIENKDLIEIHERFNLSQFWIDLLEKYEITEEKYIGSIKNIMQIMSYLKLKIKIPFLDMFESYYDESKTTNIIKKIKEYINIVKIKEDVVSKDNEYVNTMKEIQNGDYPYAIKEKHNFVKEIKGFSKYTSNSAFKVIIKHYDIISRSLPLSSESAIFFRKDPDNISIFKFLIIPNEDTPYKFGCFVFDVFIPADFPSVPPIVNHTTSRKNNFRFNPNLYSDGKVCLSLLGTWSGMSQSERWIPPNSDGTGSTLYQVIMSIYSMVFSEDPWYNEPGRESGISNASLDKRSIEYNKDIRDGTVLYAILNQLRYPEEGFEDVIKNHFKLKKDKVIEYLTELKKYNELKVFNSLI